MKISTNPFFTESLFVKKLNLKNLPTIRRATCIVTVIILSFFISGNTAFSQSCQDNNIGFNADTAINTLSICAGTSGTTIDGEEPLTTPSYSWEVAANIAGPYTTVSSDVNDDEWVISSDYYNVPGTYYFRRVVTGSDACDGYSDTVVLIVNPLPTLATAAQSAAVCEGSAATINLTGLPASSTFSILYTINGGAVQTVSGVISDGTGNAGFNSIALSIANDGQVLQITEVVNTSVTPNCSQAFTINVTLSVNAIPSIPTAGNDGPVCVGSTLNLNTPLVAGAAYSWTGPNSFTSSAQNPSIAGITLADAGTYDVTVTVSGCTSGAGSTLVVVNPIPPVPSAGNDGPVCVGSTLNLNTPLIAGAAYSWTGPNSFTSSAQNPSIAGITLADAGTYDVTVTVSGCTGAAGSTLVVVNAIPSAPSAGNDGPVCIGSTLNLNTPLVAGAAYSWTGPNSFTSSAQNPSIAGITLADAGTYDVTLTVSGCTSAIGSTSVTVNPMPIASIAGTAVVCQNDVTPNIVFTNAESLAVTITYNINGGSNATIAVNAGSTSTIAVPTGTAGVFNYNLVSVAYQSLPACSNSISGTATVTVKATPTATVSGTTTVCQAGTAPVVTFTNPQPESISISYNINGGATQIIAVAASSSATVSAPTGAAGTFNYNLLSVVYQTSPICNNSVSGTATVTVKATPTATISGTTTVCQNGTAPNITFTNPQNLPVTIAYNINGGATATIDINASTTATVAAPTALTGIFTYNLVSVVYQSLPTCTNTISGTATVTVKATPTASIGGSTTVCRNAASPNITFSNPQVLPVTITYNINGGANTTVNVAANATATVVVPTTVAGTFNYNLVSVVYQTAPACSNVISGSATVVVNPTPAPTISGTATVCQNSASPNITFTNPQALAITITYNINGGASQTINVGASTTATVLVPTIAAGTFSYNLVSVVYQSAPACNTTITGTAIITVRPTPAAGISGTTTVCQGGSSPNISFTNPQNLPVTITYNINGGANTTVNVNASATANIGAPTGTAGTFVYNLVSVVYQSAPACANPISGTATVTVNPTPVPSISGTTTVCRNAASPNITFANPQAIAVTITYNINGGANTTIAVAGNSSATVAAPTGTAGTFNYNLVSVVYQSGPACNTAISGTATVRVNPLPVVSLAASPTAVCIGSSATLTASNSGGTNTQTLSGASGTLNIGVPESRSTWAGSNIAIGGSGGATLAAGDIIEVTLNITHNNNDQLDIFLVAPSGNRALRLSTDNGGNGNGYSNALLSTVATPNVNTTGNIVISGTWGTEDAINTVASLNGGNGGNYNATAVPQTALLGAGIDGNWQIRVFDDVNGSSGTLVNWSISIIRNLGNYASVFSGPAAIGAVSYSGANNASATVTVTPPVGTSNYTVTTTDAAGCSITSSPVAVTVNPIPTVSATPATQTICSGSAIGAISITNPNSVAGTTFSWTRSNTGNLTGIAASGSGASITGSLSNSTSTVQTTTFTITASAAGCNSATTVTVTVNPNPAPTISGTTTVCQNGTSPNISFTNPQALAITVTYNINGGASQTVNVGASTTAIVAAPTTTAGVFIYNLVSVAYQVAPACNTVVSGSASVTVKPTPTASISGTATVCRNGAAPNVTFANPQNLAVTVTYNINGGANQTVNIAASASANVAASTTVAGTFNYNLVNVFYQVAPSCTNAISGTATITVNPTPSPTISGTTAVCQNGSSPLVTFTNPQPIAVTVTYNINGGANQTVNVGAGTTAAVAAPTATAGTFNYNLVSVVYQSAPVCNTVVSGSATVTVRPMPVATISGTAAACKNGSSPVVTFTNPQNLGVTVTYNVNSGANQTINIAASATATVTAPTVTDGVFIYNLVSVVYQSAPGCSNTISGSATITIDPLPAVSTGAPAVCAGSTITLSPSTGGTWISSNSTVATVTNAGVVTGVNAGTATFTFTLTATGCSNTTSSVTVNALPAVAAINGSTTSICVNDIALFSNATAGGTWSIIDGTGTASVDAGGLVTGLSAGTVTLVYTYSNGTCTNTAVLPLTINPIPVVAPVGGGSAAVCVNAITPAFTNATPGGNWSILNGTGTASISAGGVVTGLTAGTVTVVYTVDNGTCSSEDARSLTVNPLPAVAAIGGGALQVCVNSTTAAFTNATAGGTWSIINGTGTASITAGAVVTGLTAGVVTVAYTVNNGTCSNIASQTLTINALPVIAAIGGGGTAVCINSNTPAFTNTTAGGAWSIVNGTGTASIDAAGIVTGLTAGAVTVVYTVNNGTCADNVSASLTVNGLPTAGAITGASTVCAGSIINLNSNASGTGSLTYTWSSSNTSIATVINTGAVTGVAGGITNISYTVDDANNCSAVSPLFIVTVNARPSANINSVNTAICNGATTAITGTVTASGAWTITLSNGATATGTGNGSFTINVNPSANTIYSITSLVDADCTSIAADLTGSTAIIVNDPVIITTQPTAAQTACSGNSVSFSVAATGTGLTYQWRKGLIPLTDGGNISGATTATLIINPVAVADAAADYNVVITATAPCVNVTSNNASLLVNEAVDITTQPVTQTLCSGSAAIFTATATGTGLSYQWRKNGSPLADGGNIAGANSATLTISNISSTDAASYTLTVTGLTPCAPVTSSAAVLTVNTAVVITTQPGDEAVCATLPVTYTVAATGSGLTYQWYKGTAPGTPVTNNANISGATTASLHFNQANISDINDYYVVVSGLAPCAPVQSDYAHLNVDRNISIVDQPLPQTVCLGSDATFSVFATASGDPLLYQWRKNGIDIPGAVDSFLTITGTTATDAANYDVVITGLAGCITAYSSVASLTVNPLSVGGTVNSSVAVCNAVNSGILTLSGHTGAVTGWQFSTDAGANWSAIVNTGTSQNYTNVSVETMYRAIVQSGVCAADTSVAATITIKPIPDAFATPSSQTICSGTGISNIVLTGTVSGTTYNWTRNNTVTVTGIAVSGTGDISGILANTTAAPITVTFTITPEAAGCNGAAITATVIVDPTPNAVALPSSQAVCSAANISSISLSGLVSGTTYSWTRDNTVAATGIAASGTGDISGILTNTTTAPVTVTFTITPTANGCPGAPVTATVIVNPTPDATATPSSQTICSAASISSIVLSGNVAGTTFTWTRNNTATVTGIAASGSGDISGSLINTTLSPVTVTFTITPIANGCPGASITATVVVDPAPDAVATPSSQSICSGTAIANIVLSGTVPSTSFTWARNNMVAATGIAAAGSGDISGTLTNTTTSPVTVTFTITPAAAGCNGTPITATVIVNPIPNAVATPPSQTICSAGSISSIVLSGNVAGTTYNWTRNNAATVTGIAASGTGDISGALTNTTLLPVTVTFTITPIADGCPGTSITATVLVNPSPDAVATPSSQNVCSGSAITTMVMSGTVPSTGFSWVRNNMVAVTGIAASGSGNISGTVTNTTTSPVTVTFTITPTAAGCPGTPITATVTVNPIPNAVATPSSQSICSAAPISSIVFSGNISGTTYDWTRNNTASVTGIAASGSSDINGTLTNTSNALITVTFTITPTVSGCPGSPITATVAVRPTPTVNATNNNQTVCSGVAMATSVISNPNVVAGTTFSWTRDNTVNLTGIAASGSGNISGTLTNTTISQQVTVFTITATAGGCSSATTVTVTVNPRPVMTSAATAKVCNNSTVSIPLTSNIAATYTWIAANNGNVSGESTTLQSTATLTNTLINTSAIAQFTPRQNVNYTVTPTSTATGCAGTPQTVIVTVNPPYNVSFYEYPTDDNGFTICDGDLVGGGGQNDMDLIEGEYAGGTLLWQYSIGSSAGPWNAMVGPHFNNLVHDTLPDPPSIFSPMGSYFFRILVDGCPSDTLTVIKTSTLTIAAGGPNTTVCQAATPSAITLSGATVGGTATTTVGGSWSITSLNPANGSNTGSLSSTAFITTASGNIPNVTYTPPANYSGLVTLTLTSNDPDGGGPCGPLTATRTITLSQAPIISNASVMSVCSATAANINLTSVIPSTYTWTVGTITGGITGASAGSGNSINQVLTNPSTASAGTVQYIVTPTPIGPASCAAITSIITVTVNPSPAVALARTPAAICLGSSSTLTATNSGGTNTLIYSAASGTLNTAIPDDNTNGISSAIALAGSGGLTLLSTDVLQVTLNITHTYDSDLDIFLVDPSGTRAIELSTDNGGTNNNYTNTILKTDVANIIGSAGNNTPPFTGTYRPEGTITTAPGVYASIPNAALLGAPIDGSWTLRVFDDLGGDLGTLVNWSLSITRSGGYTSVVNGPASISAVGYSGANNTTATATVTPPAGLNSYTVTTTDVAGCSATSPSVDVTVNPGPTLGTVTQQAAICAGSTAQINLTGLIPNSTSSITYKINGGPTQSVLGLVANAGGNASFTSIALTAANNGQALQITSIATTNPAPSCSGLFTQSVLLAVNATPTLTGAALQAPVCPGSSAQINLTGLVAGSTATITYTINAGPVQTVSGVAANGSGAASFNTVALIAANNGQTLQVTGVTITSATPNCFQSFTRNVTLAINATPVLSSSLTAPAFCSATSFIYTATSATAGASFTWTRAAVAGISQVASSGSGNVSEVLTNTTNAPVSVTYVYTTTAAGCSNTPGQNVVVVVNPTPTLAAVSQAATVCAGSGAVINLTGLLPNTTSTISYTVNNVAQPTVAGVVADASGNASFTSTNLTLANNGQILKITGVSVTSNTPACLKTVSVITLLSVNAVPALSAASQAVAVCVTGTATINLTGLVANSTNNTINYTINGVAQTPVTGITANGAGTASFATGVLTAVNNGQVLTITGITNGTCTQSFAQNVTLTVGTVNTWLGVNTNWFDVQNWCAGILPTSATDVLIPGSLVNYPLINTGTASTRNINIQNTASVTVSGARLRIAGTIINAGAFNAVAGAIELNGTGAAQTISGSSFVNRIIDGLIISNASGVNVSSVANDTLNITDSLAFGNVNNTVLNTGNNITLVSRASKTARVADITNDGANTGNSFTGKVIVERYVPARRSWRLMTVPLQSTGAPTFNASWQEGVVNPDFVFANRLDPHPGFGMHISGASTALGFDPTPNNNPSIKYYDPVTFNWLGIPNTLSAKVTDSVGYMVFVRGDRNTPVYLNTGAPVSSTILRAAGQLKTNNQTINVPAGIGPYSVVGNPYASAIDLRRVSTAGAINGVNYAVWDPSLTGVTGVGAYQYFTRSGGPGSDYLVFPGNSGAGGGSYGAALSISNTIQSSQAFMVQNGGAGTVSINENAKIGSSVSTVFRPSSNPVVSPSLGYISTLFMAESNDAAPQLVDGALSLYQQDYSNEVDIDDAKKLLNFSSENFGIDHQNNWLQIEKRTMINDADTIQYKMRFVKVKNYQLQISASNVSRPGLTAFLEDQYLHTLTALNLNGTIVHHFAINTDSGAWNSSRFRIVFKEMIALPVTFSSVKAYRSNNYINVDWKVAHETAIMNYDVEKSADGVHFVKAYTETNVLNSDRSAAYRWVDPDPIRGMNFYRIRSKGQDGTFKYSMVVKVMFEKLDGYITLYPNPITDANLNLYFVNQPAGEYKVRLLSNTGELIAAKRIVHSDISTAEPFRLQQALLHGNYLLEIFKPDGSKQTISVIY